ncbi:MAG: RNA polymerase sigma factor [Acidimicrobiia bacterium]|nr:RNA polymerase sigma factor [Acidimicrobiia bacterium]
MPSLPISGEVERTFRDAHGQAVATLVRVFGDIDLAEDAVQDAFVVASERWPRDGLPPNPAGWIVTTARRRAIDVLRRAERGDQLNVELAIGAAGDSYPSEEEILQDDQLRLMFTCCHPSLRTEHQVALTLRLLGGLTVEEVAQSFLVSEHAMAKRLVRAKYKIKAARIPYRVPTGAELPDRLRAVLSVVYLIYNTGADGEGRDALRADAIRLGRSLADLMPDEPEVSGLLALMLLNESRMPARGSNGAVILLSEQDRTRWDRNLIAEGQAIVRSCIRRGQPGPYQLQAAIQAVHCHAQTYEDTDWRQIVTIYDQLVEVSPTPVVALNRAIAVGETEGAGAALALLDGLGAQLSDYHLLHAARGTMLRRLDQATAARDAFARALDLATTETDRSFLARQIDSLAV